jgi:hypothetical protein
LPRRSSRRPSGGASRSSFSRPRDVGGNARVARAASGARVVDVETRHRDHAESPSVHFVTALARCLLLEIDLVADETHERRQAARVGALGQQLEPHRRSDGAADHVDDRIERPADDIDELAGRALADGEDAVARVHASTAIGGAAVEEATDRDVLTVGLQLCADALERRLFRAAQCATREEVFGVRVEAAGVGVDEELEHVVGALRRRARAELLVAFAQDVDGGAALASGEHEVEQLAREALAPVLVQHRGRGPCCVDLTRRRLGGGCQGLRLPERGTHGLEARVETRAVEGVDRVRTFEIACAEGVDETRAILLDARDVFAREECRGSDRGSQEALVDVLGEACIERDAVDSAAPPRLRRRASRLPAVAASVATAQPRGATRASLRRALQRARGEANRTFAQCVSASMPVGSPPARHRRRDYAPYGACAVQLNFASRAPTAVGGRETEQ